MRRLIPFIVVVIVIIVCDLIARYDLVFNLTNVTKFAFLRSIETRGAHVGVSVVLVARGVAVRICFLYIRTVIIGRANVVISTRCIALN